jgi:hypothetical protein
VNPLVGSCPQAEIFLQKYRRKSHKKFQFFSDRTDIKYVRYQSQSAPPDSDEDNHLSMVAVLKPQRIHRRPLAGRRFVFRDSQHRSPTAQCGFPERTSEENFIAEARRSGSCGANLFGSSLFSCFRSSAFPRYFGESRDRRYVAVKTPTRRQSCPSHRINQVVTAPDLIKGYDFLKRPNKSLRILNVEVRPPGTDASPSICSSVPRFPFSPAAHFLEGASQSIRRRNPSS